MTAVYPNVYLDFGEIFPFLSPDGQMSVVKQVLELCPTNKIMWSSEFRRLRAFSLADTVMYQRTVTGGQSHTILALYKPERCC